MENKISMVFELEKEQVEKLMEWKESLPELGDIATIGGSYTYSFTPNGLGLGVEVKRIDGHTLDLTEYDKW